MGIITGMPKGPIELPDIAKNRMMMNELELKRREIKLKEELAAQKTKAGKTSPRKVSDKDPQFHKQFKGNYDKIMGDIDAYYAQYADQLNPNNTADDDIPGVFDQNKLRYVKTMEKNAMEFATHSTAYMSAGDELFTFLDAKDEYGNYKVSRDQIEQHPVFLTKESIINSMNLAPNNTLPYFSDLWEGNEDNGGINQTPKIVEGGDISNLDDWVTNDQGQLIDKEGRPMIEHGAHGKKKSSGKFLISDVYNQTITSDALSWDANGNILYGGKNYYDYFDTKFWDQGKYVSQEKSTNFLNEFASQLEYTNLLTLQPDQKTYAVANSSFTNLRNQARGNFILEDGSWGSTLSPGAAKQVARSALADLGFTNPTKTQIDQMFANIQANKPLPEGLLGKTSEYDGFELQNYSDYAAEMILQAYDSQHNFTKKKNKTQTNIYVSADRQAKEMVYNWDNMSMLNYSFSSDGPSYSTGYGSPAQTDADKKGVWMPHGNVSKEMGNGEKLWNQVGYMTIEPILTDNLINEQGVFTSSQIEMVPFNRKTKKIIQGEWDASGQTFTAYNKSDAENCVIIPCFQGYFDPENKDAIKSKIRSEHEDLDDATINNWLGGDEGVQVFAPIHRVFPKAKGERHYDPYFNMAEGITNNNIYYKDGNSKVDVTPESTDWTLPGS